jgi:maltose-binding protein MalE
LKKLMLLAALLAMVVVAAVPAIAQVTQESEQEADSGDATQNFTVTGGGDNSNACQGVQGITNTGNATNQTSVLQYANDGAEFEQDDSGNFTISPSSTTTCKTQVNQAASASGG